MPGVLRAIIPPFAMRVLFNDCDVRSGKYRVTLRQCEVAVAIPRPRFSQLVREEGRSTGDWVIRLDAADDFSSDRGQDDDHPMRQLPEDQQAEGDQVRRWTGVRQMTSPDTSSIVPTNKFRVSPRPFGQRRQCWDKANVIEHGMVARNLRNGIVEDVGALVAVGIGGKMAVINRRGEQQHGMFDALHLAMFAFLIAAVVVTLFAAGPGTLSGDIEIQQEIQELTFPGDTLVSDYGYWAGSSPAITAIGLGAMVGLMMGGRYASAFLMLAIVIARNLNPLLKFMIDSPRPTAEQVQLYSPTIGLGFPSGHVMGTVLLAGGMIYLSFVLIRNGWVQLPVVALALITVLATAFNRIWVGHHWPSDVLGGALWAMTLLLILISSYRAVSEHHSRLEDWIDRRTHHQAGDPQEY